MLLSKGKGGGVMMQQAQTKSMAKGAPSGFLISLLVHAALVFFAGLIVVCTIMRPDKTVFVDPKVPVRPVLEPKKAKPRISKEANPEASPRIVAHVKPDTLPAIAIPDLTGAGDSLIDGIVNAVTCIDIPELVPPTGFGDSVQKLGNELEGTFYDFKRNRDGQWRGLPDKYTWLGAINRFIESGCRDSALSRYYRAPKKLYASHLVTGPTWSSIAPSAFDTQDSSGGFWMVHYRGQLVHKEGITFRFVCSADYFIVILVDGEVVWAGTWNTPDRYEDFLELIGSRYNPRLGTRGHFINNDRCMKGEWITLEPKVPKDLDIIIGDEDGECCFAIAVEEKGAEYERNNQGGPIYPIFKTSALTKDMIDQIYRSTAAGEFCVTNGPVFQDF